MWNALLTATGGMVAMALLLGLALRAQNGESAPGGCGATGCAGCVSAAGCTVPGHEPPAAGLTAHPGHLRLND